ncbi:MAG TPA: hypothetical protein VGW98_05135 [Solirubrobacteraceae bacterium]|nr:hypothetical protein [Solirubrobacteraceae bacterium]
MIPPPQHDEQKVAIITGASHVTEAGRARRGDCVATGHRTRRRAGEELPG